MGFEVTEGADRSKEPSIGFFALRPEVIGIRDVGRERDIDATCVPSRQELGDGRRMI